MIAAAERRVARLSSYRPWQYWGGTVAWVLYFVFPLLPGWLTRHVFDELQAHGASGGFWLGLAALSGAEALAVIAIWYGHTLYMQGMHAAAALVRANAVHAQLASGGADAAPRTLSTGDAVARLRDDPIDVLNLADNWVDLGGSLLYGAGAAWLLARIDPWAAAVGIVPLFLIGFANSRAGNIMRRIRSRARTATSEVSSFLNAVFEATLTVKLTGAQPDVVERLDRLNRTRARAMVGDQVWNDALLAVNGSLTDTCVGFALIVAARGQLSAGEVSLFATYLFNLVWLPQRLGGLIVGRRRYEVSSGRLGELVPPVGRSGPDAPAEPSGPDAPAGMSGPDAPVEPNGRVAAGPATRPVDHLIVHRRLPILRSEALPRPPQRPREPLHRLEVEGLTITARDLGPVDFSLDAGSLTVVAGPVGSGKSSLLRGLLGLVALDAGEVRWNGRPVIDRAAFFVPPQAGYVPQVPRLFAESLADNLRLGYDIGDEALWQAIRLAVLDADVDGFAEGTATLIGSRGVRLSGGQAQRAAAARAFVHRPELLVLDDLASALDPETEVQLWERLAEAGLTVLTASNRAVTLRRADQVIDLTTPSAGNMTGRGRSLGDGPNMTE